MTHPLVDPGDLDGFPGAPFNDAAVVDAAVARVRREARWHIAPSVTETLTVTGYSGGEALLLPTMRLTAVTEVRDVTGDTPVVLTGWDFSPAGYLTWHTWPTCTTYYHRRTKFEVDVVHGYEQCPADLLPVIAAAAQGALTDSRIMVAGPFQFRDSTTAPDPTLAAYTLPQRA